MDEVFSLDEVDTSEADINVIMHFYASVECAGLTSAQMHFAHYTMLIGHDYPTLLRPVLIPFYKKLSGACKEDRFRWYAGCLGMVLTTIYRGVGTVVATTQNANVAVSPGDDDIDAMIQLVRTQQRHFQMAKQMVASDTKEAMGDDAIQRARLRSAMHYGDSLFENALNALEELQQKHLTYLMINVTEVGALAASTAVDSTLAFHYAASGSETEAGFLPEIFQAEKTVGGVVRRTYLGELESLRLVDQIVRALP